MLPPPCFTFGTCSSVWRPHHFFSKHKNGHYGQTVKILIHQTRWHFSPHKVRSLSSCANFFNVEQPESGYDNIGFIFLYNSSWHQLAYQEQLSFSSLLFGVATYNSYAEAALPFYPPLGLGLRVTPFGLVPSLEIEPWPQQWEHGILALDQQGCWPIRS